MVKQSGTHKEFYETNSDGNLEKPDLRHSRVSAGKHSLSPQGALIKCSRNSLAYQQPYSKWIRRKATVRSNAILIRSLAFPFPKANILSRFHQGFVTPPLFVVLITCPELLAKDFKSLALT